MPADSNVQELLKEKRRIEDEKKGLEKFQQKEKKDKQKQEKKVNHDRKLLLFIVCQSE
jgi:hypothetical protein